MSGSTFGILFRLTTWGESHGPAVGAVLDGCPAGLKLSKADIQPDLDRRRPGQSRVTSQRKEADQVEFLSGLFEGKTTGAPICMLFHNEDVDSSKYDEIRNLFRPGHADYTYQIKYGLRDHRGGGRASARETAPRVAAGAIAKKYLAGQGIGIVGFIRQIGEITWEPPQDTSAIDREAVYKSIVRCPDPKTSEAMIQAIDAARKEGDSLGGVVEARAQGVPPGLGDPVFDKLDADLGKAMLGIHAVKGVEIGSGFRAAQMPGSEHNDWMFNDKGKVGFSDESRGGGPGGNLHRAGRGGPPRGQAPLLHPQGTRNGGQGFQVHDHPRRGAPRPLRLSPGGGGRRGHAGPCPDGSPPPKSVLTDLRAG